MTSRRGFLAAIAGALVVPDPEQLLWTPRKRLISIPRARVSTDLPPQIVIDYYAREALKILERQLVFGRYCTDRNLAIIERRTRGDVILFASPRPRS